MSEAHASTAGSRRRRRDAAPITPYDRLAWTAEQVEGLLAAGARRQELVAYFGREEWERLTPLAIEARAAVAADPPGRERPRVWMLPGIMGSQLGLPRRAGKPADLLWLDPVDLIAGRATRLRFAPGDRLQPLGALLYTHLGLKLQLTIAGYAPRLFDYDWRADPLATGERFAAALRADGRPAMIVAHSMGGLVVRAALRHADLPPVARVVLIGTPNQGSYASVQALRGSYPVVRRIAMLDRHHDAEWLASRVFTSFPALHRMLPCGPSAAGVDFHARASWPARGPRPSAARLAAARGLEAQLVPADARFAAIAGTGQFTVVAARRQPRGFDYLASHEGDGTVPLGSALLAGAAAHVARAAHSDLPRDPQVIATIVELLAQGRSMRLPAGGAQQPQDARTVGFDDAALCAALHGKLDWAALDAEQRRSFLQHLNETPELGAPAA